MFSILPYLKKKKKTPKHPKFHEKTPVRVQRDLWAPASWTIVSASAFAVCAVCTVCAGFADPFAVFADPFCCFGWFFWCFFLVLLLFGAFCAAVWFLLLLVRLVVFAALCCCWSFCLCCWNSFFCCFCCCFSAAFTAACGLPTIELRPFFAFDLRKCQEKFFNWWDRLDLRKCQQQFLYSETSMFVHQKSTSQRFVSDASWLTIGAHQRVPARTPPVSPLRREAVGGSTTSHNTMRHNQNTDKSCAKCVWRNMCSLVVNLKSCMLAELFVRKVGSGNRRSTETHQTRRVLDFRHWERECFRFVKKAFGTWTIWKSRTRMVTHPAAIRSNKTARSCGVNLNEKHAHLSEQRVITVRKNLSLQSSTREMSQVERGHAQRVFQEVIKMHRKCKWSRRWFAARSRTCQRPTSTR